VRAGAAAVVVVAAAVAWAGIDAAASRERVSCAASVVRYQAAKHSTFHDTPWILARPATRGVLGFVVSYPPTLRDGRVNRSDGLVLWTKGARIVWAGPSIATTLVGRRLDGSGAFRLRLVRGDDGLVSDLRFASPGCWRLRLGNATAVVRVVSTPSEVGCAATPLADGKAFARPRSSRIYGGWGPWRTRAGGALLYTHGHGLGLNMKVPWWAFGAHGSSLGLAGTRLDADGAFTQEFPEASSPSDVFPSIVDVPAAGCWLFRLRTGRLAGVLVVQAIDARG
jgi:hypothetical protein